MNISVNSNFERLLRCIAFDVYGFNVRAGNLQEKRSAAGSKVKEWQYEFKAKGGFRVEKKVLEAARQSFASDRVSDAETVGTIRNVYRWPNNS